MDPRNPFGNPQGGAFQPPINKVNSGLFQPFGQQSSSSQSQTLGFLQTLFGQAPGLNRPSFQGSTVFGQTPSFGQSSFGQTSTRPPSLNVANQAPAFGKPSVEMVGPGFGSTTTTGFCGQSSGQSSVFGQAPVFGQHSSFRQTLGFGQQVPGFGNQISGFNQQPLGFGKLQLSSSTTPALGLPQSSGFGQSLFGQTKSTDVTTSTFGIAQNRGFGSTQFSFKPAHEAVFKPILSASPELNKPQAVSVSDSPFGGSGPQTGSRHTVSSSSTTAGTGFPVLPGKPGVLEFNFSQSPVAPSISVQTAPVTTDSGADGTLQFSHSQPAATSTAIVTASATQPTTPSFFSFTAKTLQPQATSLFGVPSFGQLSAFGDSKRKADAPAIDTGSNLEGSVETNVFGHLTKATKHKEDSTISGANLEKPAKEGGAEVDSSRQPPKKTLMRSRGPTGGLFSKALSGLRKDIAKSRREEVRKENQPQTPERTDREGGDLQLKGDHMVATPPGPQSLTTDLLVQDDKSDLVKVQDPDPEAATPVRRSLRQESSESLSETSPTECTAIQCKNVPAACNKRTIIHKHFAHFGKICKLFCRPDKNLAIVHFHDHESAAKAKKEGRFLHGNKLQIFRQRTKQSPRETRNRSTDVAEETEVQSQEMETTRASSPLKRPPLRAAVVSSTVTFSCSPPVKKPAVVTSLIFASEPQLEGSTDAQTTKCSIPSSLLHLVGQVAETAEEKYHLLEQRDKILRQGRPKQTELILSKVFVGTCPDMCPEKERYMRETRNQLSAFEVLADTETVDHATAVKEYSRSSADQEEPLPHELRPLPVLIMTMDYLVTQIMDRGHENYRDWYDFVWNRTRGIRKDITQQHLCCPHTVSLFEKCTRFHIHCGHHLCEEPMLSFDAKINNENMTKCLQSLKEMYQDLAAQHIYCPQEAEFRQYSVLLKLNDGDILREVQQFREDVRNSPEVKFAVQAFSAVNSNNFVCFFQLVKRASYLSSCILHRYFNQVRATALKILNVAYTVGPRSTAFPLKDIVRMFMFDNAAETMDFIQQYGLSVSDDMVELSRTVYQEPDLPLSQKKSEVIMRKKTILIGEVVNGGSLPNVPQHTPVCSFDSQNKYRGESLQAEPSLRQRVKTEDKAPAKAESQMQLKQANLPSQPGLFEQPEPVVEPVKAATDETGETRGPYHSPAPPAGTQQLFQPIAQPVKPPSPKPQPVYNNEDIEAEVDSIMTEVVESAVSEIAHMGASYATIALVESSDQVESVLSEVLGDMIQEVMSTEIQLEEERVAEEKRKLEEERRRKKHLAFLTKFSFSLCSEILSEVSGEIVQEVAISEIKEAVNQQFCISLIEETLDTDITLLVEEILEVQLRRIHKYIKRWREVVALRRQLKRQMRGFPAAPCYVDPRFKLKALCPSAPSQTSKADLARGLVNMGNAGILTVSSTRMLKINQEVSHQMRVQYYYQQLLQDKVWASLDLPALVTENFINPPDRIFWKVVLLLPSEHESAASIAQGILSEWLEVKFGGEEKSEVREQQPNDALQTLCLINTVQLNGQRTHKVHISVKASRGPLSGDDLSRMEDFCEIQGTGALIMLLPALPNGELMQDEQDVPLLSALLQLKQLQQASTSYCPLPVVFLVPGPNCMAGDTQRLEEALMLHTLVSDGLISEYKFFFIPESTSDLQSSKQLTQAVRWLVVHAPQCPPLSCQTLVELVEHSLAHEFTSKLYDQRQERADAHLPSQDPVPIIQLYNAVLSHLADVVSLPDLSRLSWPAQEFCLPETRDFVPPVGWNSAEHLNWLRSIILSLQLPQWELPSRTDSWPELCAYIFCYAAQIPISSCSRHLLMSRLENLLERVRLQGHGGPLAGAHRTLRDWVGGGASLCSAFSWIPWDDVLAFCIDHKLKDWRCPGRSFCEGAVTEDGEILVYFLTESLKGFSPPDEWTEAVWKTYREKKEG
ncbi:germinal-center associated nuclear protein isoform X2 [Thalassophryne amazonica]|nr:germinal-center associated nuclear protein isoform X2 [Thalassophryne amazonica]